MLGILLLSVAVVVVYKTAIVRTVESGNGYKHQIGHFGACDYARWNNCEEATHRICYNGWKQNYCENCWEKFGKENFEGFAYSSNKPSSSDDATDAKVCAKKVVEDNLKAPSTAKFCSFTEMEAKDLGGKRWEVSGYVDAQNSFGATVRQYWTVTLTLTETGFKDYSIDFS